MAEIRDIVLIVLGSMAIFAMGRDFVKDWKYRKK